MALLDRSNGANSDYALRVSEVSKTFRIHQERASSLKAFIAAGGRNRYEEFWALRDVSFDVEPGQALGIIGHNGSGKSTLLKCMAGILTPNVGQHRGHQADGRAPRTWGRFPPGVERTRQRLFERRHLGHGP